jgi:chaperonin cofactor prefoldin
MSVSKEAQPTQDWIVQTYQRLKSELETVSDRLVDFDAKYREHHLVCETLKPLDESRRCYQLLGGVLVERTVKDVLPVVEKNCTQYQQVPCSVLPPLPVQRFRQAWPLVIISDNNYLDLDRPRSAVGGVSQRPVGQEAEGDGRSHDKVQDTRAAR